MLDESEDVKSRRARERQCSDLGADLAGGAQLLVRTTAELGAGAPPRYTFETWLGGAGDEAAPDEMRWLGAATYP